MDFTTNFRCVESGKCLNTRSILAGYRVIDSTSNVYYLDCGNGNWLTGGNSWCDPYKTWQMIYKHDPVTGMGFGLGICRPSLLRSSGNDAWLLHFTGVDPTIQNLIVGGETASWTEIIDKYNLETKIWPRSASAAERYVFFVKINEMVNLDEYRCFLR